MDRIPVTPGVGPVGPVGPVAPVLPVLPLLPLLQRRWHRFLHFSVHLRLCLWQLSCHRFRISSCLDAFFDFLNIVIQITHQKKYLKKKNLHPYLHPLTLTLRYLFFLWCVFLCALFIVFTFVVVKIYKCFILIYITYNQNYTWQIPLWQGQ